MSETKPNLAVDIENEVSSNLESSANFSHTTENEIINVDEIELSDEDTWLYESPNSQCSSNAELSPYKWLRKDVEDPNNRQLQLAKTALVSKLDELEILKAAKRKPLNIEKPKTFESFTKPASLEKNCDILDGNKSPDNVAGSSASPSSNGQSLKAESANSSGSQTDIVDIFEKARRQEQSLNESSLRFFSQAARTLPRSTHLISPTNISSSKLQKPASIEALHAYNGRQTVPSVPSTNSATRTNISSPNRSPYGSNASLNYTNNGHRSSLPNLNKGYYSLKKKPMGTNEPKMQCPLPIYPKKEINTTSQEAAHGKPNVKSPVESHTLPSSYRAKSKSISNSSCDYLRRESFISSKSQWNNFPRQGSNPNISQQREIPNGRFVASPRKGASTPSLQNLRTVSLSHLSPDSNISPIKEYSIHPSPISPVAHSSSSGEDGDDAVAKKKVELVRKSSLPTRIPSPAVRSGIPMPSSQTKSHNGWDRNCH